jgi:Eco29kI restriction endonuclease
MLILDYSELIRTFKTIWNSCIDGFGIHDPGSGRYHQQRSEWDTLHPGRMWADKLTGIPRDLSVMRAKVKQFLAEPPQE